MVLLVLTTCVCVSRNADAQLWSRTPTLVDIGTRVRVGLVDSAQQRSPFASPSRRLVGTVRAIAPETLYLDLPDGVSTLSIPRATIRGVRMSLGRPSRIASALDVGSGGAFLCALFLPGLYRHPERRFGPAWRPWVTSAAIGFGAGALVGAVHPYERWRIAWIPE